MESVLLAYSNFFDLSFLNVGPKRGTTERQTAMRDLVALTL